MLNVNPKYPIGTKVKSYHNKITENGEVLKELEISYGIITEIIISKDILVGEMFYMYRLDDRSIVHESNILKMNY